MKLCLKFQVKTLKNVTENQIITHHNCHYLDYFQSEFADNGTETCFMIEDKQAVIRAVTSGKRREGIIYSLFLGDVQIPDATEDTEFNNSSG